MLRLFVILGLSGLCACTTATGGSEQPVIASQPITLPMDPGQITCAQIAANAAYLPPAAAWVTGQLRAATLQGRYTGPTTSGAIARSITGYCELNQQGRMAQIPDALIGSFG